MSMHMSICRYSKASDQGCTSAQNSLGLLLERGGSGIVADAAAAVALYSKAAEAGEAAAAFNLGYCYQHGVGVTAEPKTAVEW